jgi:hypothetical protein
MGKRAGAPSPTSYPSYLGSNLRSCTGTCACPLLFSSHVAARNYGIGVREFGWAEVGSRFARNKSGIWDFLVRRPLPRSAQLCRSYHYHRDSDRFELFQRKLEIQTNKPQAQQAGADTPDLHTGDEQLASECRVVTPDTAAAAHPAISTCIRSFALLPEDPGPVICVMVLNPRF